MEMFDTQELRVRVFVATEFLQLLPLPRMHIQHVVIETRHVDPTFRGMQRCDDLRERLNRIQQYAAVQSGMEISFCAGDVNVK